MEHPEPEPTARTRDEWAAARRAVTDERERRGRNRPWLRRYRIARRKVGGVLLRLLLPVVIRLLARTWRVQRQDFAHMEQALDRGMIIALWHGRMLPALPLHGGLGLYVLVSPSDDGELVMSALRHFGYHVIRGSTSRFGARALREMRGKLAGGKTVVITPDGPRGPRHGMNVGLAWLARATALPILPLGVGCDRAWRLSSWDRFVIPKPFARISIGYAEPIPVGPDCDEAELDDVTARVQRELLRLEAEAFARLGADPDW